MSRERWSSVPLKTLITLNPESLTEDFPPSDTIHYAEISDVSEANGIRWGDPIQFGAAPSRARRLVRDGDVLVSTVRTYLRAVAGVRNAPECAVASTGFAVLRPRNVDARYLEYSMLSSEFLDQVIARSVGISYPAINATDLISIRIPIPSIPTQRSIAKMLDRETAKIDAFIADQEELIGLLAERRAATISHAVTKGLDPTVPMKDSGVEWIGHVPATWKILNARRVFAQRNEQAMADDVQLAASQEFGVIPQARYTELTGYRVTTVLKGFEILKHVEPGDFVISMRSFQGGLEYSKHAGKISSAYVMLSPQLALNDEYFGYLFKSKGYISALRATSNLVRDGQAMRFSNFAQVSIPVPPLEEQFRIAAALGTQTSDIDAMIADAKEAIALSRERRAALISAAVTGKIDVREQGAVA